MNICTGCTQAKKKVVGLEKFALTKCSLSIPGSSSSTPCERCTFRHLPCSGPLDSKSRSCRNGEREKDVQSLCKIIKRRGPKYFHEVTAMAISSMTQSACGAFEVPLGVDMWSSGSLQCIPGSRLMINDEAQSSAETSHSSASSKDCSNQLLYDCDYDFPGLGPCADTVAGEDPSAEGLQLPEY